MNIEKEYLNIVTDTSGEVAEILLYGYIGQDFFWSEELKEESITDLLFTKEMRNLESQGFERVNIRINSPGGSIYHGDAIISAIRASKMDVHTYIDGMAASMAFGIFMAVDQEHRHWPVNAKGMAHAPINGIWGNAVQMRKEADVLDKFEESIIAVMATTTSMTEAELKSKYFDGEDHWLTAADAIEHGLISEISDYTIESSVNNSKMNYAAIMQQFFKPNSQNQQNVSKIKLEDIQAAIASGDITAEQLNAISNPDPVPAPVVDPPAPPAPVNTVQDDQAARIDALIQTITSQSETINSLKESVEAIQASTPAAGPSNIPATDGDPPERSAGAKALDAFNAQLAADAMAGKPIRVTV